MNRSVLVLRVKERELSYAGPRSERREKEREREREREKGAVWGRKTGQARVVAKARELAGD